MFRRLFYYIPFTLFLLLLYGCHPMAAPPQLKGSPAMKGLAVVDARINVEGRSGKARAFLRGASIYRLFGDKEELMDGKMVSGMLIFSDLSPGIYRIRKLEAVLVEGNYMTDKEYLVPNIIKETTFKVEAGRARYVGKFVITAPNSSKGDISIAVDPDYRHQILAWDELIMRYKGSPWRKIMKESRKRYLKGE